MIAPIQPRWSACEATDPYSLYNDAHLIDIMIQRRGGGYKAATASSWLLAIASLASLFGRGVRRGGCG